MVAPFASADVRDAHRVWVFIGALATLAGLFLLLRELGARSGTAVALSVAGLALPVVAYDLRWAQTNGVSMLGIVLAWIAFRRRREGLGGAALGVLAALRVFPLLLVVPLLVRRRWAAVRWFAGVAAAVSAVGVVALGPGAAWTFVRTSSENVEYWSPSPLGISLITAPVRWLRSDLWIEETAAVPAILNVIGFALLLLCVAAIAATRARETSDAVLDAVPWMILATPIAWPHYLVMMLPTGIAAIRSAWAGSWRAKAPAAVALAAMALAPNVIVATGRYFDPASTLAGQRANSAVLTTALIVVALAGRRRREAGEPRGSEATG
jgi:alpha-1,2-mannosyltransferase